MAFRKPVLIDPSRDTHRIEWFAMANDSLVARTASASSSPQSPTRYKWFDSFARANTTSKWPFESQFSSTDLATSTELNGLPWQTILWSQERRLHHPRSHHRLPCQTRVLDSHLTIKSLRSLLRGAKGIVLVCNGKRIPQTPQVSATSSASPFALTNTCRLATASPVSLRVLHPTERTFPGPKKTCKRTDEPFDSPAFDRRRSDSIVHQFGLSIELHVGLRRGPPWRRQPSAPCRLRGTVLRSF